MKKAAIKGLVALAAVVALCMFFSGTIKTITTAKVKLVTAKQGKLEEEIKLSGKLTFPKTEDVKFEAVGDRSLTITRVRVAKGRRLEAGDVLYEAEVTGYDKEMESLKKEYDQAQAELLELERKNGDIRLKRTEEIYMEAYDQLALSKENVLSAQTELEVAARLTDVKLIAGELSEEDAAEHEDLAALQTALSDAKTAEAEAQKSFNNANRLGISEDVLSYVTKSRDLKEKMRQTQEQMASLTVLSEQAREVTAPHSGYVVEVNIKNGDSYDGRSAAIVMSAEDVEPVLRADTSEIDRSVEKGTSILIKRSNGKTIKAEVEESGVDDDGRNYADVPVSDKDIKNLGGGAALLSNPVEMTASYRAGSSTTLLPVSAVRGSGDNRYVYVVKEEMSALGERILKVSKMEVKVLAEVGGTASIENDLDRQRVAYMEDRAISEGSEVMVYAE